MTIDIRFWHTMRCWVGVCLLGMLFACSESKEAEESVKPEQITYKVNTSWYNSPSETRATLVSDYNTLANGGNLLITSKIHGTTTTYFEREEISVTGTNVWQTAYRFLWPSVDSGQKLDFYAIYPSGDTNWDSTDPFEYTTPEASADQKDLMYGVTLEQTATSNTVTPGQVPLNMKHALSAVSFHAKSESSNMTVRVKSIKLCNVLTTATFKFPTTSTGTGTSDNYTDCWSSKTTKGAHKSLTAGLPSDPVTLTTTYQRLNTDAGYIMMLPQPLVAWDRTSEATTQTGSYLVIECNAEANNRFILGADASEYVSIYAPIGGTEAAPLSFEAGKHYQLQMEFGLGYNSEGQPNRLVVELTAQIIPWTNTTYDVATPLYPNQTE